MEQNKEKKILILTSGGDAPGMNAAVKAIVCTAYKNGVKVMASRRGYQGLLDKDIIELKPAEVCGIIKKGGTVLYTARCDDFVKKYKEVAEYLKGEGFDAVIVIGGDGSFRGARDLSACGIPSIGVPGTIDNDVASTEYTIGYDTALNTVIDVVDRIADTTESHDRCMVLDVMGAKRGYIALNAGIAAGATAILIPEHDIDLERDVFDRIKEAQSLGKKNFTVICAEGIFRDPAKDKHYEQNKEFYTGNLFVQGYPSADALAKYIEERTGIVSRGNILGHLQRGGNPSVTDRVIASRMGEYAVKLVLEGKSSRCVALNKNDEIVDFDIEEAVDRMKKSIDLRLYDTAMNVSL